MVHKRHKEGAVGADDKPRRFPNLRSVIMEVMRTQYRQSLERMLEPSIRKVVKEEVEHALVKHFNSIKRSCSKEVHPSETRSLQLQFLNPLSPLVFTGARIAGIGSLNLKIALVDGSTSKIVNSGPESSAKLEIVVLEGDFGSDEGTEWMPQEFENNIVREREGRKPLLTGDVVVNLKDGISLVDAITFSDNSSWTRSRRFRLGARVIDHFDGIQIKEARTEPFIVKDHRGELYKKHHPPSLDDEVWRLEKIGKDGAFHRRLAQANIKSVKNFLTQLFIDPTKLRDILGPGMSSKMWEVTEEHARTCVLDNTVYLYCPHSSQLKCGVVFDIMGHITGLLSEGQYIPVIQVSQTEKASAEEWLASAARHWGEVVSFDSEASLMASLSRISSSLCSESSRTSSFLANNRPGFDYREPSVSSPAVMSPIYTFSDIRGFDDSPFTYDRTLTIPTQGGTSILNCETLPLDEDFFDEDHLQYFEPQPGPQSTDSGSGTNHSSNSVGKAQMRWRKVFSVLKWISVKNLVVARRKPIRDASVPVVS